MLEQLSLGDKGDYKWYILDQEFALIKAVQE